MFGITKNLLKQSVFKPARNTTLVRYGHGYEGGHPGNNLPFSLERSKLTFTILFTLFFGSGLYAPFWVLKHQLLRK